MARFGMTAWDELRSSARSLRICAEGLCFGLSCEEDTPQPRGGKFSKDTLMHDGLTYSNNNRQVSRSIIHTCVFKVLVRYWVNTMMVF